MGIDFKLAAAEVLVRAPEILPLWFPKGRFVGKEFVVGNLEGEEGKSLSINVQTGAWCDFAVGEKGGDLISLHAAKHRVSQTEAARQIFTGAEIITLQKHGPTKDRAKEKKATKPPMSEPPPSMHGSTDQYVYRDADGSVMFYVSRYDTADGKRFKPWTWDIVNKKWQNVMWPAPRPYYGLEITCKHPLRPVLIVEGERKCDAARAVMGEIYNVITWAGGSGAVGKTDWSALEGASVLIWPDADDPGHKAAAKLCEMLRYRVASGKIVTVSDMPVHWDIHDAIKSGMDTYKKIKAWAHTRVSTFVSDEKEVKDDIVHGTVPGVNDKNCDMDFILHDKVGITGSSLWFSIDLELNNQSKPVSNMNNAVKILEADSRFRNSLWYDEFYNRFFCMTAKGPRHWDEAANLKMTVIFQRVFKMSAMTPITTLNSVKVFASEKTRNEPKDWMESLEWDGVERVKDLFPVMFGAGGSEYTRAVSKNFMVAIVNRIYYPGCKFDNVVVLEGPQGIFKSSALKALAGERWFASENTLVTSNEFFINIQGKMIIEIPEKAAFIGGRGSNEKAKAMISTETDRYRDKYGIDSVDHPRKCVFVITTNNDDWNTDPTGARRYWPIICHHIDLDAIKKNREQIFAEAVAMMKGGYEYWRVPNQALIEQQDRREYDEWESIIGAFLEDKESFLIRMKVVGSELGFPVADLGVSEQRRIGAAMRVFGWKRYVKRETRTRIPLNYWAFEDNELKFPPAKDRPVWNQNSGDDKKFRY